MPDLKLSIKAVCKQTGLSPHLIRTWEKRYGTVKPVRSAGNQRLYNSDDIERLSLLRLATESGHSIGTIATLSTERLRSLVGAGMEAVRGTVSASTLREAPRTPAPDLAVEAADLLGSALDAVGLMDAAGLERVLDRASVVLGQRRLLNELVVPLVREIGDAWLRGEMKVANEHVATAVLRTFLGNLARPIAVHPRAPGLLVTTPAGQLHELGAILVAATASGLGWRVVYCGASLPAEEIAAAAIQNRVRAVGLSVVHPADDPTLGDELLRLRRLLPDGIRVIVGGYASGAYLPQIEAAGANRVESLDSLAGVLNGLRLAPPVSMPG